jgi:hypothetical protein
MRHALRAYDEFYQYVAELYEEKKNEISNKQSGKDFDLMCKLRTVYSFLPLLSGVCCSADGLP